MTRESKVVRERRAEIKQLRGWLDMTPVNLATDPATLIQHEHATRRLAFLEWCEGVPTFTMTSGATRSGSK